MTSAEPHSDQPPSFHELGLAPSLLKAVAELGYETPTPIQVAAIPPLLVGRDLVGQAQTGTGKTAAFALPLLQRLDLERNDVQAIVLAPTRELAMQVAASIRAHGKYVGRYGVSVLPVYGGQPIHIQRKALRRAVHVVVGTPGRVSDHLRRGTLDLTGVHFFCLDEADEMLNMGFLDEVEWILDHAPKKRQIALFSATMPKPIRRVAAKHLSNPIDVRTAREGKTVDRIEQRSMRVSRYRKNDALERILGVEDHDAVLVFVGTQRAAAEVAEHLQSLGFGADCIHGGMDQKARDAVVGRLRRKRIQIVVGTDVAARGLDVDHVSLVINYDLPRDPEVYVHRVGRTGRAGREGRAISIWQPREQYMLRSIERFIKQSMKPMPIPGVEELLARQRQRMRQALAEVHEEGTNDFRAWAEAIASETDFDPITLAAAALRLAWGDGPLRAQPVSPPSKDPSDYTEIVIPVGSRDRMRPGTLVGIIAGETELPGHVVGRINMRDTVSFVGVRTEHVKPILAALQNVRVGRRVVSARLAHPDGAPRRPTNGGRKPYRGKGKGPKRKR